MKTRILLIDDDVLLGHLIQALLSKYDADFTQVFNGKIGIDTALLNEYDHILIDLMLPQIDGLNVIRTLKAKRKSNIFPKLTAISARRLLEQQEECMNAGADYFLQKPVQPQALLQCLTM